VRAGTEASLEAHEGGIVTSARLMVRWAAAAATAAAHERREERRPGEPQKALRLKFAPPRRPPIPIRYISPPFLLPFLPVSPAF
jgi:hypothetical protein